MVTSFLSLLIFLLLKQKTWSSLNLSLSHRKEGLGHQILLKAGTGGRQALHILPVEEPAHDPAEGGVAQRRPEGHPEAIRLRVGDGDWSHRLGRRRRRPHCRCKKNSFFQYGY